MNNFKTYMLFNETLNAVGVVGLGIANVKLTQDLLIGKKLNGDDVRIAKERSQLKAVDSILKGKERIQSRKKEIKSEMKSLESNLLRQARFFLELSYELEEILKSE